MIRLRPGLQIRLAVLLLALPAIGRTASLDTLADDVLAWRTATDAGVRLQRNVPITSFDRLDAASASERSYEARGLLARLRAIDRSRLSMEDRAFAAAIERDLITRSESARFQPLEFVITPYGGGDIHQFAMQVMSTRPLNDTADAENYVRLLQSYARVLDDMLARVQLQRARGIFLPKAAIPNAAETFESLRAGFAKGAGLSSERIARLAPAEADQLRTRVEGLLTKEIDPRIARLRGIFDAAYLAGAPTKVGLSQYPDGDAYYRHLIYAYTGEALDPRAIHQLGMQRIAEIDARLSQLRDALGFKGTRAEFQQLLRTDARWIVRTPGEVEARYMGYTRRIEPRLGDLFETLPKAPYGVMRLDPAAEPGMTYGYYQQPTDAEPRGLYRYNGSDLAKRSLIGAQHLIYHELMPGHHLQLALARESSGAHPLRQFLGLTAYVEGWAEYGASLAEDLGLYQGYDEYGHLMMRSFLAARLVVDTGLNTLGWSLAQARDFMRAHTLESDTQIESELLRYSTDIPGQALGYYLGYEKIRSLRERAQQQLGDGFDLKSFHAAVLGTGSVPLNALEIRIDDFIAAAQGNGGRAAPNGHFAAVNRAHVVIDRSPAVVWRTVLNRASWMPGFVGKRMIAGERDRTGELSVYTARGASGRTSDRLEEILLASPEELLVLRLAPPSGDATYTFAEFRLTPQDRKTRLDFDLYWVDSAPSGSTAEEVAKVKAQYVAETQKTIEKQLVDLDRAARSLR